MRVALFLAVALALPIPATAERPSDPAYGLWLTENEKAIVAFAPCGSQTCGRMVWIAEPVDARGAPKRDLRNADRAQRGRPICGLVLVGGLSRAGKGAWDAGWLYNPRDGETYSAEVRALSSERLEVRGYLGVPLLGQSRVWTRVADDRGGCPD